MRHRQRRPETTEPRTTWVVRGSVTKADSDYASSVKFRVTDGSTGMPGPVVVETTTFFR